MEPASEWHVVVLRTSNFSALASAMTREGRFPRGDYGTRCVCCDKETTERLAFDASGPHHSASAVRIPRCPSCEEHVATGNWTAMGKIVCLGVGLLGIGAGWTNRAWTYGWIFLAIGVLGFAGLAAIYAVGGARRAAMRERGHHTGLEITAIPGLVSVRTTNPRFADELRERNAELVRR